MNENTNDEINMSIGSRLMVHFRHIKKIFKNEEQEEKRAIEININSLEEWLDEKSKPLMEDVTHKTDEILMRVNEELQRARFNVEALENAKLQNPNIPFKAKQYMEGNRKAYARSLNSFLGHMEINNKDYHYLLEFCRQFDELANDLSRGTLRSYTILQEFFAHETKKIAQNLKSFDTLFKELDSALKNEKVVAVTKTKEKTEALKSKIRQKINLDLDFKTVEVALKLASDEKEAIMADIADFSKSGEHANFANLNEEKKAKEKSFYESQSGILQSFSVLERPLRKYSHIAFEHEEAVLDYLKSPIDAMVSDKEMMIVKILGNLEAMLKENRLQVDERKKEKSIEEIKKINSGFIGSFVKKYFSFKNEMKGIEDRINATKVAEKLRDFNQKLEDTNSRIEKDSVECDRLKRDVARTSSLIESLKSEIEGSIAEIFNEDVRISV